MVRAWLQLAGRWLVVAGRQHRRPPFTADRLSTRSALGEWKRAAAEQDLMSPEYFTNSNRQSYSLFGISAVLFCGVQSIDAEKLSNNGPTYSTASMLNEATNDSLDQETVPETAFEEVASNVHTAKWRVYTDVGRDLFSKGRFDEAEKYLLQALEEAKQGFGENDPHVASSCNNLAELYRVKREFEKAEPLFLEAVERLEKAFNPDHESVSFALHNLAGTYLLQKKFDKARICYERSLKIKEKTLGKHHPEYANTLFHLGEVLRVQGELIEAEKKIRDSISILEEGAGYSQLVVKRMGRLVEILLQTGQLHQAEKVQRKILHILELSQGLESTNTTTAAENLAGTLQAVGKLSEAEELLQRSFQIRQQTLPPTHIQIGVTMFKLASVSIQRGDELASKKTEDGIADAKVEYENAEQLLKRAIRIAERSWKLVSGSKGSLGVRAGPLISLLRSLDALGCLEMRKSELATRSEVESGTREAESLFRQCLSILDKIGVSLDFESVPEIQRQHVACLRHLARLLTSAPNLEADSARKDEIARLINKSESIEAELRKSKELRV